MRCCTSTTSWNSATAAVSLRPGGAEASFLRGTAAPAASVGTDSIGSLGNLTGYATDSSTPAGYFIPTDRRSSSGTSARRSSGRPSPATAKLLLSLPEGSARFQSSYGGWRARPDVGRSLGCRHWSR